MAEKWLELNHISEEKEKREFILGTLFPDIRYLKELSRRETHEPYPSLAKVRAAPTLFESGKIFHAWLDEIREFYLSHHQVYDQLSFLPVNRRGVFLKFLEDEMVFSQREWKNQCHYLEEMLDEEKELASESAVKKWHFFLQNYLSASPSTTLSFFYLARINIFHEPREVMAAWKEEVPRYAKDLYWQKHLQDLTVALENKMKFFLAQQH
jgi:hypothetical protein